LSSKSSILFNAVSLSGVFEYWCFSGQSMNKHFSRQLA